MIASPYKGLTHYTEEDSRFFFGRESERQIITANLMASRLTLLYAESGVGKSSLLRAGVARQLRELAAQDLAERGRPEFVTVVFSAWRDEPVAALVDAILAAGSEFDGLPEGPRPTGLAEAIELVTERLGATLLVILDQFEEYFLYHPEEGGDGTFATELPRAVNRLDLRAGFLVAIREDALARLDRFQGRIPNLFDNYLRIEHLTLEAARVAIEAPIEELNRTDTGARVRIEPELVAAVLEQVTAGKVDLGESGRGSVDGAEPAAQGAVGAEKRVETPYLQLVMTRLWTEEAKSGSPHLRLETLRRLGGAETIIRTHLDEAMHALTTTERDAAATIFRQLVTPSGTKIAHSASDLAEYAQLPEGDLTPVLEELSSGDVRILRPVAPPPGELDGSRYEIFHDVLAPAILDWRTRYVQARDRAEAEQKLAETEAQARRERRRARIFRVVAAVAVAAAMVAAALGFWAYERQQEARSARKAADAIRLLPVDPSQSVRLLSDALREKHSPGAETLLREALSESLLRRTLRGHSDWVTSAAFTHDGRSIATASEDRTIRIWDGATGRAMGASISGHTDQVLAVAFNRDGRYLVSGGALRDGTARVWDWRKRVELARMRLGEGNVVGVSFSPDGEYVATASDRGLDIWDWRACRGRSCHPVQRLSLGSLLSVAFSPDGRYIAAGGASTRPRVWRWTPGRRLKESCWSSLCELQAHGDWVNSVAFSPDGRFLLTASDDKEVHVYDLSTGSYDYLLSGHTGEVKDAEFSPDGRLAVTASSDGTARVWDWRAQTVLAELHGHSDALSGAAFSPDGRAVVSASADRTARTWTLDFAAGRQLRGHHYWVLGADFSPDGRSVATASADGTARIWNAATARVRHNLEHPDGAGWIRAATFNPDGRLLLTGGDDGVGYVWNVRTGARVMHLRGHTNWIFAADFSRDGALAATASADSTARVWTVERGKPRCWPGDDGTRRCSLPHPDWVYGVSLSPDGRWLATACDDQIVRIWDLRTGKLRRMLAGHEGSVSSVDFSSDGKRLVTAGSDLTARVWVVDSGEQELVVRGHAGPLRTARFSPDGEWIVTAGADKSTRVWDAESGRLLGFLRRHADQVRSADFSADGRLILTAGDDNTAKIYGCETCSLPLDELLRLSEERVG